MKEFNLQETQPVLTESEAGFNIVFFIQRVGHNYSFVYFFKREGGRVQDEVRSFFVEFKTKCLTLLIENSAWEDMENAEDNRCWLQGY